MLYPYTKSSESNLYFAGYPPSMSKYIADIINALGVDIKLGDDEKIINEDPEYMKKSAELISNTDNTVVANYLGWRVYKSMIFALTKDARKLKEQYNRYQCNTF